jgi:hypothetical protein
MAKYGKHIMYGLTDSQIENFYAAVNRHREARRFK